jgi:hypothetical protein
MTTGSKGCRDGICFPFDRIPTCGALAILAPSFAALYEPVRWFRDGLEDLSMQLTLFELHGFQGASYRCGDLNK